MIDIQLSNRLERAEYSIRVDWLTLQILIHHLELKADELSEQANILSQARIKLWENKNNDCEVGF